MITSLNERLDEITERALAGDVEAALHDLQVLLRDAPGSSEGWLTLATIFSSLSRWSEAEQAFERAVALGEARVSTYLGWARVLEKLTRPTQAAAVLQRAHELAPSDAAPLSELAALLYQQSRYQEALTIWQRAAALAPNDARPDYASGLCHEALHDPATAIASYRRAIARDPKFTAARKTLADLLAAVGEHDRAIAELDELLRLERTNEQAAHNREVLARARDEMHARRLLGKGEHEWQRSALVHEAALDKIPLDQQAAAPQTSGEQQVRYASRLFELVLTLDGSARARESTLVLRDPERAGQRRDDLFKVTVVAESGAQVIADLATGISLTFLREGLGISLTQASLVYRRVLAGESDLAVAGARVAFTTLSFGPGAPAKHGLTLALVR